jgi:hypothetical protein
MILLVSCSVLYGALAALVLRRTVDAAKLRVSINRIVAHIIEFRLFIDEPALIWRAQKAAFRANVALLRQLALPCVVMAVPLLLLWSSMERRFGHGPLGPGETTIVTAHTDQAPVIDGLTIETPGVRIARTGEVSWRVRATRSISATPAEGVVVRYPQSNAWIPWFFGISTLSALAFTKAI